jgi:Uma2 family endonuclease
MAQLLTRDLTLEEFEQLHEEAQEAGIGRGYEYDDGDLILMSALKPKQGSATSRFNYEIAHYIQSHGGGEVFYDSFTVFGPRKWYYPDLTYLTPEELERYDGRSVPVPSTLIVEITTESSYKRDTVRKKQVYHEAGIRWYWIVDPVHDEIIEYRHAPEGYEEVSRAGLYEPFTPRLFPGLTIHLKPLPTPKARANR